MTLLRYAAQAASRGFHIFPCNPEGTENPEKPGELIEKWPHLLWPDKPYKVKWGEVATDDIAQVVRWWQRSPNANIGIACKPSGILVVDCDMPKRPNLLKDTPWESLHERYGPLVDGSDVLREMCERFGDDYDRFGQTFRVCTASMGLHLYFRWPEGVQASQASPVPGLVDIRCNGGTRGGYVLGAGSATTKGMYVAENALPIADAPPWLIELCREKPKPKPVKSIFSQPGHANYVGLVDKVRTTPEGNRSHALYWAACAMDDDGAGLDQALALLTPAAIDCGLYESEAEATIKSAYRRSKA